MQDELPPVQRALRSRARHCCESHRALSLDSDAPTHSPLLPRPALSIQLCAAASSRLWHTLFPGSAVLSSNWTPVLGGRLHHPQPFLSLYYRALPPAPVQQTSHRAVVMGVGAVPLLVQMLPKCWESPRAQGTAQSKGWRKYVTGEQTCE